MVGSWQKGFWIVALCAACGADGEATPSTVGETHSTEVGEYRRVELTDLTLDCERPLEIGNRAYAYGYGDDGHVVLAQLPRGEFCDGIPARPVGEVTRAPHWMASQAFADPTAGRSYVLFRVEPSRLSWPPGLGLLLLLGLGSLWLLGRPDAPRLGFGRLRPHERPPLVRERDPYRADETEGGTLPPVSFRLSHERVASEGRLIRALALTGLTAAVCGLAATASIEWSRIHDEAVWSTGVESSEVRVTGYEDRRFGFFYTADPRVTYTDTEGRAYTATVPIRGLFAPDAQSTVPTVRFDPAAPERFALSWRVERSSHARRLSELLVLFGFGGGMMLMGAARSRKNRLERWRRIAASPHPVVFTVVEHRSRNRGSMYRLRLDGSDVSRIETVWRGASDLAFLDEACTKVIGLRDAAGECCMALREDLFPFDEAGGRLPALRRHWRASHR